MPSLQSIKTRKDTVSTVRKVTKAMELISTSKIRKAKNDFEKVFQYSSRIKSIFHGLNNEIKDWDKIIKFDFNKPKIFVVISSDLGLCGGYNSNIIKLSKQEISKNDYLVIIGSKGKKTLTKIFDKDKILLVFESIGDNPNYEIVDRILDKIVPLVYQEYIGSVNIISTDYINSITYKVNNEKIFPFAKEQKKDIMFKNVEFEPNPSIVLKKTLPLYIGAIIFEKMASSKISEMTSRRLAMENSSSNALDIINNLEKQYNKIRQSKITQEIIEIVAGAKYE